MQSAAGLQNKVIDYVAIGLPVICSNTTFKAFNERLQKHLYRGESVYDFVKFMEYHQSITAKDIEMANAAFTVYFSPKRIENLYKEILD